MATSPEPADRPTLPRFAPEIPFPPYSYVTGRFPHPISDPGGHSFGLQPERPAKPDPERWSDSRGFLHGIDLFNHGYYWEAHEVWEGLWHACGRSGTTADFLKGLIKLAAAGVKARERRPEGVRRHGRRARELFEKTIARLGAGTATYMGLDLAQLCVAAQQIVDTPPTCPAADPSVSPVFSFILHPR